MPIPLGILAVAGAGAGGGGAYELIETTQSTGASITFSNLDNYSQYKHLQIRAVMKGTGSSTYEGFMRFNGVTSGYAYHNVSGSGFSVTSQANTNQDRMGLGNFPGTNAQIPSEVFGVAIVDILDFSSTSKNKTIRSLSGFAGNNDVVGPIRLVSGFLNSTTAVTSITIGVATSTNIASGSRFSLYGIK